MVFCFSIKNILKMDKKSTDAVAKKRANTSGVTTEVWMTIVVSGWNLWVWLVDVVSRRRV